MMLRFVCPAAVALAFAAPVLADDARSGNSSAAAPSAPEKPAKEKKICRRDADTGSYIPHSICRTKEEWQAADTQNGPNIDRGRHNFGHGPGGA
jgi:hypothetical protein